MTESIYLSIYLISSHFIYHVIHHQEESRTPYHTDSNSEFAKSSSNSSKSDNESEDDLTVHGRRSFQDDILSVSSEAGFSGNKDDNTPLAKYPPARQSISSLSSQVSTSKVFSTPDRSLATTSPHHYTRSQHKHDQILLSHIPPSLSGTPGSQFQVDERDLIGLTTSAGNLQVGRRYLVKNTRRSCTCGSGSDYSHGSSQIQVLISDF